MTKTINTACCCGGTFRIDNAIREIGLTQRGIIVATSERRIYDWLCDYIKPYEENRYAIRYAETEQDFSLLAEKRRMAIAFIETDFFGERAIGCIDHIHKENPRLRVVLFSVASLPREDKRHYLWRGADSVISLREKPELVQRKMKSIFDGYDSVTEKTLQEARERNRLAGIPPHLTPQEVEVCRFIAREKGCKEIADCLSISVKTVDNHLCSVRKKFGKRNRVGILRIAVSIGILSPEELADDSFYYSALPLTDHTC
jgi:DNA-binding NarL/FixJ family response regulator